MAEVERKSPRIAANAPASGFAILRWLIMVPETVLLR
jgi:hypothetical protein